MSGPYLTPEEVAQRFGLTSDNYIRENAKNWPHVLIARQIRFTEEHVEQIARLHAVEPATPIASRNQFGRRTRGGAA